MTKIAWKFKIYDFQSIFQWFCFRSLEEARALAREAHAQEMLQQEKDRADMLALEKKRDKYLVGFEQKQLARRVDQKNVIEKKTTERNREAQALHETKQDILRNERVTVEKRVHKFQDLLVKVGNGKKYLLAQVKNVEEDENNQYAMTNGKKTHVSL